MRTDTHLLLTAICPPQINIYTSPGWACVIFVFFKHFCKKALSEINGLSPNVCIHNLSRYRSLKGAAQCPTPFKFWVCVADRWAFGSVPLSESCLFTSWRFTASVSWLVSSQAFGNGQIHFCHAMVMILPLDVNKSRMLRTVSLCPFISCLFRSHLAIIMNFK